jgi:hypothetical protein
MKRRGFTFVELLIILAVIGIGVYFGSVGTSGQISYYYLRGDVEKLVAGLHRAAVQSSSRGELSVTNNVRAGVTFYRGRFTATTPEPEAGFSFLPWFEGDPLNPIPRTRVAISALDTTGRTYVKPLNRETILTRTFTPAAAVVRLDDNAFFSYRDGRLDVFTASGTVVDASAGHRAELRGFFQEEASTVAPLPVSYTFDVVNAVAGWVRVRVYLGGFVEASAINSLDVAVPTNASGGTF